MHPYLRFIRVVAGATRRPRVGPFDESRLTMRVGPGDVEVRRMNNGRYLTLMDLGRFDLAVRLGCGRAMLKNRWQPLVRSATITFEKSLELGQEYDLVTRIVGHDEKWWFIEQRFEREGKVCARAYLTGVFRGPNGNVRPRDIMTAGGHPPTEPPPLPAAFRAWLDAVAAMRSPSPA